MTRKQKQLFDYLCHYITQSGGVSPSYDEMKDALGLASKSGIHRLVESLIGQGYIRRPFNRARAIEIVRLPSVYEAPAARPIIVNKTISLGVIASHIALQTWCRADLETVMNSLKELRAMEEIAA